MQKANNSKYLYKSVINFTHETLYQYYPFLKSTECPNDLDLYYC